jgi:ArsR family transcriptional regulator, arsenate/arsenite/antimonite-responsive transcriptional repressor
MLIAPTPAKVFHALGDEARLRILEFLAHPDQGCCTTPHGVCGCDLQSLIGLSQPTVSYHLKLLSEAGLILGSKRGRWVYYTLSTSGSAVAMHSLERLFAAPAGSTHASSAAPIHAASRAPTPEA